MTIFQENQTIGKYTVQYLIKSGEVCSTYKVCDAKENAFFMKIFDDAAVADARKLKSLKIPAILLFWHYDSQDPTARALKDEISFQININSLLKTNPSLLNKITEAASS